jgi:hypothetical protein
MKEQNQSNWNKVGIILWKMIFSLLYNSFFVWIAVNLFFVAFSISFHLTITQSISVCFLYMIICSVFGIGKVGDK